jgi:hypothetical protein
MRLLALLLVLPSLAFGQGLTPNAPGVTGGGKVLWQAPFATPGCYASGQTAGASSAISITRTTKGTVALTSDPSVLTECAAGEFRVAYSNGLLVEPARTNVVKLSGAISTANAFDGSIWIAWPDEASVDVTTGSDAPMGGKWHTITNEPGAGSNVGQAYQTVTTGSSTTFVASAWMKKPVGEDTTHAGIHVGCGAGTPSACACVRSDGGSCTASTVATNYCQALVADLSTTPVRVSARVTCSGAITTSIVALVPGSYGVSVGITDFGQVQHEIGTFPSSNILTTSTATARNADAVSATVPAVPSGATGKWCLAGTYKPNAAWATSGLMWRLAETPTSDAANDALMGASTGAAIGVYDSTGTIKLGTGAVPSDGARRIVGCDSAGTLSVSVDGAAQTLTLSGAGTGIITTPSTNLRLGQSTDGQTNQFGGFLKSIKICKASKPGDCR